jgi:O-methyltransferase domain
MAGRPSIRDMDEDIWSSLTVLAHVADLSAAFAIRTFSELGVADCLQDGPRGVVELAELLAVPEQPLRRLLEALCTCGVLARPGDGVFGLTPVSDLLRSAHATSLRDAYRLSRLEARAWGHFSHCLRTGEAAFEHVYGQSHRLYRAEHPEEDARMDSAHRAASKVQAVTLIRAYPWAGVRTVVDVGAGTGAFLVRLLGRYREMRGTLFELPQMAEWARELVSGAGLTDRCAIVAGDFFESVPAGADVYVLKTVLGGWDDAASTRIMRSVRAAMRDDSRVVVIEPIMGYGDDFSISNIIHLQSLLLYGGLDRTPADYEAIFGRAGLRINQIIRRAVLPVMELVPRS